MQTMGVTTDVIDRGMAPEHSRLSTAWVELFGKSWWGKTPWLSLENLKQEFKCKEVFKCDNFASLRWKMFVLKPENDQI